MAQRIIHEMPCMSISFLKINWNEAINGNQVVLFQQLPCPQYVNGHLPDKRRTRIGHELAEHAGPGLCSSSMKRIQILILILAATVASGLLFVNIYTSMVDAPNWGRDVPASLVAAREYFSVKNPGNFFRVFSPLNQLLALAALVVSWWAPKGTFSICLAALILAVAVDVFTFAYFYPRNEIMFVAPIENIDAIRTALTGWQNMNWIRSGMIAVIVVLDYLAMMKISQSPS